MHFEKGILVGSILLTLIFTALSEELPSGDGNEADGVKSTILGLLRSENDYEKENQARVAVGFGSCLDVMVPALKAFEKLNLTQPPPPPHRNFDFISSMEQFEETFAYFFQRGASAGRYVTNSSTFDRIFDAVKNVVGVHVKLGGNAAAMSRRFQKEGAKVMLLADVDLGDEVNQLEGDVKVSGNRVNLQDVHLIFEYEKGDKWGILEAPRANRFILYKSSEATKSSPFPKYLEDVLQFRPDVLVVGGFRDLSRTVYGDGKTGLDHVNTFLSSIPKEMKVHVELSSFSKLDVLRRVLYGAVVLADSLGMNEQELPNLMKVLETESNERWKNGDDEEGTSSIVSESKPSLAKVLDNVRSVMKLLTGFQQMSSCSESPRHLFAASSFPSDGRPSFEFCKGFNTTSKNHQPVSSFTRLVSRIHVHTLAFQAVATVTIAGSSDDETPIVDFHRQKWKNSRAAMAKSALTANRHTCGNETVDPLGSMVMLQRFVAHPTSLFGNSPSLKFDDKNSSACWEEAFRGPRADRNARLEICVAPVPVCKKVKQTVGGGDNVSAAGLVPQA